MFDDEDSLKVESGEIFEVFPFLASFPFDYYDFELEKNALENESSMLDPIIIKAGGGFVEPHLIKFKYSSSQSDTSISFYTFDVRYIHESSDKIKKMDDIARTLQSAIVSNDFREKLRSIKEGEKTLKKIGTGVSSLGIFDRIVDQINEVYGSPLSKSDLQTVKKLNLKIVQSKYSKDQQDVINDFYDLHLHHANIVLGIVIATKIHI